MSDAFTYDVAFSLASEQVSQVKPIVLSQAYQDKRWTRDENEVTAGPFHTRPFMAVVDARRFRVVAHLVLAD